MRVKTLGLILGLIGMVGGVAAYLSVMAYSDTEFLKMGLLANFIQALGLVLIYADHK